jgi:hypothetical protein
MDKLFGIAKKQDNIKQKTPESEEIEENPTNHLTKTPINIVLGEYKGSPLKLKSGEKGYFLEWGTNLHVQKLTLASEIADTFDLQQAIEYIQQKIHLTEDMMIKKRIFRILDPFTDIRQGKYGTYIRHKTECMHKPAFISLKKCKINYMLSPTDEIMEFVYAKCREQTVPTFLEHKQRCWVVGNQK